MSEAAAEAAPAEEAPAQDFLAMSDEDILNMTAPGVPMVTPEPEIDPAAPPAAEADAEPAPAAAAEPAAADVPGAVPAPETKPVPAKPADDAADVPAGSSEAAAAPADKAGVEGAEPAAEAGAEKPEEKAPNYEDFYKKVMTPFKANGKTVELKSPEEAVSLMQMGANYTRKMQELVPHRKQLTMLQNNNIDENKLSFLIDLDKRDPEAIKKLIKESGIDLDQIDTSSEPAYLEGNHRVTDEEVNFGSALEDLKSTPDGLTTLKTINDHWDQASKEVLWKNPGVMATIHEQREYGIYDRIAAEVDRQKTLGKIPATTPFLEAYRTVGDQLTAAGGFADLAEKLSGNAPSETATPPGQVEKKPEPQPVATRAAVPKPTHKAGDAASAASPTRATPANAQPFVNPLSMSDDEFLKTFNGRL